MTALIVSTLSLERLSCVCTAAVLLPKLPATVPCKVKFAAIQPPCAFYCFIWSHFTSNFCHRLWLGVCVEGLSQNFWLERTLQFWSSEFESPELYEPFESNLIRGQCHFEWSPLEIALVVQSVILRNMQFKNHSNGRIKRLSMRVLTYHNCFIITIRRIILYFATTSAHFHQFNGHRSSLEHKWPYDTMKRW